jgi:hypothetical protein
MTKARERGKKRDWTNYRRRLRASKRRVGVKSAANLMGETAAGGERRKAVRSAARAQKTKKSPREAGRG